MDPRDLTESLPFIFQSKALHPSFMSNHTVRMPSTGQAGPTAGQAVLRVAGCLQGPHFYSRGHRVLWSECGVTGGDLGVGFISVTSGKEGEKKASL